MSCLNNIRPKTAEEIAHAQSDLEDQYTYHPWNDEQKLQGKEVREAIQNAALAIIKNVPPSPDRSAALRKLREARMDANSAITHNGKY